MDAACVASACSKDFAGYVLCCCVSCARAWRQGRPRRTMRWPLPAHHRSNRKKTGTAASCPRHPWYPPLRPPHIGDGLPVVGWIFLKTHFFGCGMDLLMNYGHEMSSELQSRLLLIFTVEVQNRWFLRLRRLAGSPVGSTAEAMNHIQLTANRYTFTTMSAHFHTQKDIKTN